MIQGYMLRHKVKPGITGLAQVRGWRGETDTLEKMQRRVECDHEYIREWSLWLDVKILFRTVLVVLERKNVATKVEDLVLTPAILAEGGRSGHVRGYVG